MIKMANYLITALAAESRGDYALAATLYQQVNAMQPTHAWSHFNLGE